VSVEQLVLLAGDLDAPLTGAVTLKQVEHRIAAS
jgi:hypothetical protein